jgi:CRP-like cAMP-binding protein
MQIDDLVGAVQSLNAEDAFRPDFTLAHWRTLAPYLSRHEIAAGDLLIKQGDSDRTMYLIAAGTMLVYLSDGVPGSHRVAILRAGSIVGEPGLFGPVVRMANVEAMTACTVFALRAPRLDELSRDAPLTAAELLRAAGAVMAVRLRSTLEKHALAA